MRLSSAHDVLADQTGAKSGLRPASVNLSSTTRKTYIVKRLGNLSPGTPTFEIFVRRNIIWKSYGLHSWDRDAFPALKDLDSRRVSSDVE